MKPIYFFRTIFLLSFITGGLNISPGIAGAPSDLKLRDITWTHHSSGVRSYNLIDVYRCTLYFPKNEKPDQGKLAASVKKLVSPVAIHIEILTSLLPDKMPEVWRETIESEVTGKAFRRFQKGFAGLDEGDVLLFSYLPEKDTQLLLNGKPVFKDPGPGLMQGLLEQWMGSNPISEDLKEVLIGE